MRLWHPRARSIARLSPAYCCDAFRWRSLGQSEARFWATNLFDVVDDSAEDAAADGGGVEAAVPARATLRVAAGASNPRLAAWGLPAALCAAAVNPGFRDPFSPDGDVTLNNPRYWGLMQGKLDWVLLRGAALTHSRALASKSLGNDDYALSDHKWLAVDIALREA